jgi:Na+/melibiose symporter-like transporter
MKLHLKKLLGFGYLAAWAIGLGMLGASLLWLVPPPERTTFVTLMCILTFVIWGFRSYEEYQRAIRAEHVRQIKEAIRDTMDEMRRGP